MEGASSTAGKTAGAPQVHQKISFEDLSEEERLEIRKKQTAKAKKKKAAKRPCRKEAVLPDTAGYPSRVTCAEYFQAVPYRTFSDRTLISSEKWVPPTRLFTIVMFPVHSQRICFPFVPLPGV
jgi:hypothetical protein